MTVTEVLEHLDAVVAEAKERGPCLPCRWARKNVQAVEPAERAIDGSPRRKPGESVGPVSPARFSGRKESSNEQDSDTSATMSLFPRHNAYTLLAAFLLCAPRPGVAQTLAPLPNANEILQRALANERKLASQRERYQCRVIATAIETDSSGNTKKNTTEVKDQFFVNGIAIERTLQKNGQDLTPEETKKEDDRVMKETLKYSNQATARERGEQAEPGACGFFRGHDAGQRPPRVHQWGGGGITAVAAAFSFTTFCPIRASRPKPQPAPGPGDARQDFH